LSTGDFERRIRGALGMEYLTLKRLREPQGGPTLLVTLDDMLKKALGTGISIGAPLQLKRMFNLEGDSYTGDTEKCMKEGSSNRASISEGLYERYLEGRSFTGDPKRYIN
jgi:hypothetical protein